MYVRRQKNSSFIEWQYEIVSFVLVVYKHISPKFLFCFFSIFLLTACNSSSQSSVSTSIKAPSFTVNVDIGNAPLTVNFDTSISSDDESDTEEPSSEKSVKNYVWDFGDGSNANGITASHQYLTPGTYQATLLVSSNGSTVETSEARTITVLPVNAFTTAAFTVDVSSGVTPMTVNFDAARSAGRNGNIISYEWDFGDGSSSTGIQTTHNYYLEGTHTARLTVTDDRGGQGTMTQTIFVDGNGGVTMSGNLYLSENITVDSDINDLNSAYESNNTLVTAQPLPYQDSLITWGFVTKNATGIEGQRFAEIADDVDIYRATFLAGQRITLDVKTHTDENGLVNANDIDLFLYSVGNNQSPVDSSLSTSDFESVTAPVDGDYFIIVSAFSGKSSYTLSINQLTSQSAIDSKQRLSLAGDFVAGQVIAKLKQAKLKQEVINTSDLNSQNTGIQNKTIQNIRQQKAVTSLDSLSQRNNMNLIRGNTNRASLFSINTNVALDTLSNDQGQESPYQGSAYKLAKSSITQDNHDSLFDGRYGFGLNSKDRQAYEIIKTVKRLRADSSIQYAEPNYIQTVNVIPNDNYYDRQWHYPAINLPQAWDITNGDAAVIVAVIDTGVFMAHEDLSGNLLTTGYDFIASTSVGNDGDGIDSDPDDPGDNRILSKSSWHGTHVAGTIAASANNGIGVTGVAPGIRIMPIRTLGVGGGSSYDVSQSILYAAGLSNDSNTTPDQPADIINMSLGGKWYSQSQADAISAAQKAGVITVASAGNNNSDDAHYPANYPGVISVGAVGQSNERAYYSNYGSGIDLVAPGGDDSIDADDNGQLDRGIMSTFVNTSSGSRQSGYKRYQGTSMSTPHVTGVIALMKSIYPDLTPELLNTLIANGLISTDLNHDGESIRNDTYGYGLIDANKAVRLAETLASGFIPQGVNEIFVSNEIENMLIASQQKISIKRLSGNSHIDYVQMNMPWATITPLGEDSDGNEIIDGDGTGEYQLDIDRTAIEEGSYQLIITFVMDNGEEYSTEITVSENVTTQVDAGTVYLLLIDEVTREIVSQTQIRIDASEIAFSIDNIHDGDYVLFAGTDFDGDQILEDSELFGAAGSASSPTVYSVTGSDITGVSVTIGSTTGIPIRLSH